jgi:hypothetical protein
LIDVRTLNAYSSRVRRKFLAKISLLGWEEAVRNREASYYSLVGIILHMIDNEDWVVNLVIPGRPATERKKRLPSEFTAFEEVEALLTDVETKTPRAISEAWTRRNSAAGSSSPYLRDCV